MGRNKLWHKIAAVLIFVIIAFVVFYLFYLNSKYRESDDSVYRTKIEVEPIENYEIREKPEGRFIVNDQAGFMFMIPAEWNIEMVDESENSEIKLLSPDVMINQGNLFPSKGCTIGVSIIHSIPPFLGQENLPQHIKKQIVGDSPLLEGAQEVVTVDNRLALKTFTERDHGGLIRIELPINNTIYHFGFVYSLADEDECIKSFNRAIDSVSID